MNISIIGSGYVGLVTAVCLAEFKHNIICLDKSEEIISDLKKGKVNFYEPELQNLLRKNLKRISFTNSYKHAVKNNVIFLCVDTPVAKNGNANISNLKNAVTLINKNSDSDKLLVIKSTVPVGTNAYISKDLSKSDHKFELISNPEFLREGNAVNDFLKPDRIIIGSISRSSKNIMKKIYSPIISKTNLIFMSPKSAEITKYASNAFLATKISFINEISELAKLEGSDIKEIQEGLGSDRRIGKEFLNAGIGYGGSCFPKDLSALQFLQRQHNFSSSIIFETIKRNNRQLKNFEHSIRNFFRGSNLKLKSLLFLGLSFKPNTDDIRESLSIKLIKNLHKDVGMINAFDPVSSKNAMKELNNIKNIKFYSSLKKAIHDSNAIILCTEWDEFKKINPKDIVKIRDKVIFDGRNFLSKKNIESLGIKYHGIGII